MEKHFKESIGEFMKRVKSGDKYPPLRSFKELCEELGIPIRSVMGKLKMKGAPKPRLRHSTSRKSCSWYEPKEFKKWWETVK